MRIIRVRRLPVFSSCHWNWSTSTLLCSRGSCYIRESSHASSRLSQTCPHERASRDAHPFAPFSVIADAHYAELFLSFIDLKPQHRVCVFDTASLTIRHFHEGTAHFRGISSFPPSSFLSSLRNPFTLLPQPAYPVERSLRRSLKHLHHGHLHVYAFLRAKKR